MFEGLGSLRLLHGFGLGLRNGFFAVCVFSLAATSCLTLRAMASVAQAMFFAIATFS
jgi:hypothetical protein